MGVNLPAQLVIIKSTNQYDLKEKCYVEYPLNDLKQMVGRVGRDGRPGNAIIMTEECKVSKYQNLSTNIATIVESCLDKCLEEAIIEEMSSSNLIMNKGSLIEWFKETLLFIRKPKLDIAQIFERLEPEFLDCVSKGKYQVKSEVKSLQRREIPLCTLKEVVEILENLPNDQNETLWLLSNIISQFPDQRINLGDKKAMRNLAPIVKYPSKVPNQKNSELATKIFLFTQMLLGGLEDRVGASLSIKNESTSLVSLACNLIEALLEIYTSSASLASSNIYFMIELLMILKCGCWPTGISCLQRQINGLGHAYSRALADHGINSIEKLRVTDPRRIEVLLKRQTPFGNQILNQLNSFPQIVKEESDCVQVISKGNAYWIVNIKGNVERLVGDKSFNDKEIMGVLFENFTVYYKRSEANCFKKKSMEISGMGEKPPTPGSKPIEEFDFEDVSIFQESQADSEREKPNPQGNTTPMTLKRKRGALKSGVLCSHNCKNKVKCRHACCKRALDSIISVINNDDLANGISLPKDIDSTLEWLSHYRFPMTQNITDEEEMRLIFS